MKVVELRNGNVKLMADEGKMLRSRLMHLDEESGEELPDVCGEVIYLGRNDVAENYEEVEKEEEEWKE